MRLGLLLEARGFQVRRSLLATKPFLQQQITELRCARRGGGSGLGCRVVVVVVKRPFTYRLDAATGQTSGHWLGSGLGGSCAALKITTPKHVRRGEKFKTFPDRHLLHLLFLLESNYGKQLCEKCSVLLVTVCSQPLHQLPNSLLHTAVDRNSSRKRVCYLRWIVI